ncbi:MAG: DUF3841 domain-containing protein [Lachnospiraceae bacterium]|nr:DUF3841 domain-containing protein [Lachnospiraceae bacterium]
MFMVLWMTVKMDEHGIRRINKAKYPVWAWHTRKWKHNRPDLRLGGYGKRGDRLSCIEFEIPESEVLLSDFDAWHFVLNNLWLDGSVTEAERKNEIYFDSLTKEEQERAKADSWNRIFDISPYENDWIVRGCYIQAVFWKLRPDMVTECRFFTAK